MHPVAFPQANCHFGPPPGLDASQVACVPAYRGTIIGGNLDGSDVCVVAWEPSAEDIERIRNGQPVYVAMMGGLAPHFLCTEISFPAA